MTILLQNNDRVGIAKEAKRCRVTRPRLVDLALRRLRREADQKREALAK